jgi:hypothetical protein
LQRRYRVRRNQFDDRFNGLGPELWGCGVTEAGHLSVQGVDTVELVEKFNTPLHVVDKNRLIENLNHFIGSVLGNTGYKRDREREFLLKNVPKKELLLNIEETKQTLLNVFENFNEDKLGDKYPINVFDKEMSIEYFLIHLHSHLNYHLGQINTLRRIIMD